MAIGQFLLLFGVVAVSSRHVNFYRKDYTYLDEFDAFYKLHLDGNGNDWSSSFLACDNEGAELFYPKNPNEWTVVKKLLEMMPEAPNVTDVYVGIHDKFGLSEYITINGSPTPSPIIDADTTTNSDNCVTMNVQTGALQSQACTFAPPPRIPYPLPSAEYPELPNLGLEPTLHPFVCKKTEDVSCPTIDKGYKYFKDTNKCYKVNDKAMSWSKAMETCFMEGGILLVIKSDIESRIIREQINDDTKYYAGFKKLFDNNQYYTVKGHKLEDSGFPDSWYRQGYENPMRQECGSIIRYDQNVRLNSEDCGTELPFVCEIEVQN